MNTEILKQAIVDQRKRFLKRKYGVLRSVGMSDILKKRDIPHVQVITGLRRAGKSVFMRQIVKELCGNKNFYYLNFDDERFVNFPSSKFNILFEILIELYGEQDVIFIDEIQNIKGFQNFVRRLNDEGLKFYVSGSNAELMSKEIGTKLTGRHLDLLISPFSFSEYLTFKKVVLGKHSIYETESRALIQKHFEKYLYEGGMPEYCTYKDEEILQRTYEDIVIKDIAVRHKIENINTLRELYRYLISNFCRPFSYNSLLKIVSIKNSTTIKNYIDYLENSYLVSVVERFSYSSKSTIRSNKKIYVVDNGFISTISSSVTQDKGWYLENLVYNTLAKTGKVFYHKDKKECDFLVVKDRKVKKAVQVCFELTDRNRKREISGVLEAMNTYGLNKGVILTNRQEDVVVKDGKTIEVLPVWKWLLVD